MFSALSGIPSQATTTVSHIGTAIDGTIRREFEKQLSGLMYLSSPQSFRMVAEAHEREQVNSITQRALDISAEMESDVACLNWCKVMQRTLSKVVSNHFEELRPDLMTVSVQDASSTGDVKVQRQNSPIYLALPFDMRFQLQTSGASNATDKPSATSTGIVDQEALNYSRHSHDVFTWLSNAEVDKVRAASRGHEALMKEAIDFGGQGIGPDKLPCLP